VADAAPVDVLDVQVVARLAELRVLAGRDVLGDLVALFVRDLPPQLAACREALERTEPDVLRRAAHAARGDAGALGASELAALCARIEAEAAAGWPGELRPLVDALEPAFHRARSALEALVAAPVSTPR
jgi:HPt (histidine-containing phosphotransfer) domain-containing protein